MTSLWRSAVLAIALCAVAQPALAFVFRIGDTVYVDGKPYSWEEWKKIRDGHPSEAPTTQATDPGTARAASCVSSIYYDEFPNDDERFDCSAGLGGRTRDEILRAGWKIDLIEKIPSPPGSPAQSVRGLPLYRYKLVISRADVSPAAPRAEPATARKAVRRIDSLCMNDCLGTGGTRAFCQERCTD